MPNLRALLVLLTIMAMVSAPLVASVLGAGPQTSGRAFAATVAAPVIRDNDDKDDGDDDDNDSNDDDNDDDRDDDGDDNGDDDDDTDDEDDDNGDDDNDNHGDDDDNDNSVAPKPAAAPAPRPSPSCSTPGQDIAFVSGDGRVTVRVFSNMSQSVKFSIRQPIDPSSVAPAPGPVVGGLLFQLIAETCDGSPLATLPTEVNLGVSYSNGDASGLNEANFSLARLNTNANQWQAAAKQATDPPANYTSATVTDMGYYVLYQRP